MDTDIQRVFVHHKGVLLDTDVAARIEMPVEQFRALLRSLSTPLAGQLFLSIDPAEGRIIAERRRHFSSPGSNIPVPEFGITAEGLTHLLGVDPSPTRVRMIGELARILTDEEPRGYSVH